MCVGAVLERVRVLVGMGMGSLYKTLNPYSLGETGTPAALSPSPTLPAPLSYPLTLTIISHTPCPSYHPLSYQLPLITICLAAVLVWLFSLEYYCHRLRHHPLPLISSSLG